jgi:hypothetical protein
LFLIKINFGASRCFLAKPESLEYCATEDVNDREFFAADVAGLDQVRQMPGLRIDPGY